MDERVTHIVKEYVNSLKEDEVKSLHMRLEQNFTGDLESVLLMIQKHPVMDSLFKSAETSKEFDSILNTLQQHLDFEQKRYVR